MDSRRWDQFRPRSGDIVIATYPKCGTTWMQRIVSLLVLQSPEPIPLGEMSPWIEMRIMEPIDAVMVRLEDQRHRRFVKTHLPFDGLPIHDAIRYIHVARDGRDACMSYHNHCAALTGAALSAFDAVGREDDEVGCDYPRAPTDPAAFFRRWIRQGGVPGHKDGLPHTSFFTFEQSYWAQRKRSNFLFVHYNDLKMDLHSEMCRIADYLEIPVTSAIWPDLVEAASFKTMRRDGDTLMPQHKVAFNHGKEGFFFKGRNDRWRGVFDDDDLALYDTRVEEMFSPDCANWVANGRLLAVDPRSATS